MLVNIYYKLRCVNARALIICVRVYTKVNIQTAVTSPWHRALMWRTVNNVVCRLGREVGHPAADPKCTENKPSGGKGRLIITRTRKTRRQFPLWAKTLKGRQLGESRGE